jgi:hypothetical protein
MVQEKRHLYNLLTDFSDLVDKTHCFMNDSESPELIFVQEGQHREIINQTLFNHLLQKAGL